MSPKKKSQFDPAKIKLDDVRVINGELRSSLEFPHWAIYRFDYEIEIKLSLHPDGDLVLAMLNVDIQAFEDSSDKTDETRASYMLAFIFVVTDLADLLQFDDQGNVSQIDHGLGNAVVSVSYSTARGMIATRLQGTSFAEAVLPIVGPNELMSGKHQVSQQVRNRQQISDGDQ